MPQNLSQRQYVPAILALIAYVVHNLSHQIYPQPSYRPFLCRQSGVNVALFSGVKRLAVVTDGNRQVFLVGGGYDVDYAHSSLGIGIVHYVDHCLLHSQVNPHALRHVESSFFGNAADELM